MPTIVFKSLQLYQSKSIIQSAIIKKCLEIQSPDKYYHFEDLISLSIEKIKKLMINLNGYSLLICSPDKPDKKISSVNYLDISNELTNKNGSTFILIKQI